MLSETSFSSLCVGLSCTGESEICGICGDGDVDEQIICEAIQKEKKILNHECVSVIAQQTKVGANT